MIVDKFADLGLIIAIVGSAVAIVGTVIAMFFWVRSEANNDRREFQHIQREDRKDLLALIKAIEFEIKDFHRRLEQQNAELKSYLMNQAKEHKR
jgi:hypothetical protein